MARMEYPWDLYISFNSLGVYVILKRYCKCEVLDSSISDEVIFNYNSVDTRYFENQEDADKYAETGDFDYSKSNYNKTENYTFKASHKFVRKSNYTFEWWLSQQDANPTDDLNANGTTN